ncbi:hypothetical protein THF5H11_140043 [Vibrio jasicida]|nr:hypothetical protein THF5H11_140043 [Vibrio jasicida]
MCNIRTIQTTFLVLTVAVTVEVYLSVFNEFIITYRFFFICTTIYNN